MRFSCHNVAKVVFVLFLVFSGMGLIQTNMPVATLFASCTHQTSSMLASKHVESHLVHEDIPPSLIHPMPDPTSSDMIVCVLTRRGAFQVRQAIRNTWAAEWDNIFFIIGTACHIPPDHQQSIGRAEGTTCEVRVDRPLTPTYPLEVRNWTKAIDEEDMKLLREQQQNRDILFVKEVDFYDKLPAKLKACYDYSSKVLSNVSWSVKVDDDFYVDVNKLYINLHTFDASVPAVVGNIVGGGFPPQGGKWKELPQYPAKARYPKFPLGSYGHAVSGPLSQYLSSHTRELFAYQGEDVSLGIWLEQSDLKPVFHSGNHFMTNGRNCRDQMKAVVGHNFKTRDILACFTARNRTVDAV